MKKSILLLVPLLLLLVQEVSAVEVIKLDDFSYTKNQVALADEVIKILEEDHFLKRSFGSVQLEAFDLYLERLDPNKNIFLSSELNKYKEEISKKRDIEENLKVAYDAFKTYGKRYQSRYNLQVNFLNHISDNDLRSSKRIIW